MTVLNKFQNLKAPLNVFFTLSIEARCYFFSTSLFLLLMDAAPFSLFKTISCHVAFHEALWKRNIFFCSIGQAFLSASFIAVILSLMLNSGETILPLGKKFKNSSLSQIFQDFLPNFLHQKLESIFSSFQKYYWKIHNFRASRNFTK